MTKNETKGSVAVRIPTATLNELKYLLDHEVVYDADGQETMKYSPMGLDNLSNAQVVNIALLAFLSGSSSPEKLKLLIYGTPKVGEQAIHLASQRLIPKRAVLVPSTAIADILENQKRQHEELKTMVSTEHKLSERRFRFVSRVAGFLLQGVAAMCGYTINRSLTERESFDDTDIRSTYRTLMTFGDDIQNDEKLRDEEVLKDDFSVETSFYEEKDSIEW